MKFNAKLSQKYGSHSVMLPPPPEEELDFSVPEHLLPTIEDPDMEFLDALEILKNKNRKLRDAEKVTIPYKLENMHKEDRPTVPFTAKEAQLYMKYAVMLPPGMDEDVLGPESKSLVAPKVSPFLSQFVLEEGDDALDPSVFEDFEPEVTKDRGPRFFENEAVLSDFDKVKQDIGDDVHQEHKAPDTDSTIPPKKKATLSADKLVKLCSKYYNLASK